jgi:predicted permease
LDVIPAGRELVDDRRLLVRPLAEQVVDRDAEQALFLLAGAVALVLGIGVFNLMNLQVSWLSSRQRELSIRGALGESAWGVLRRIVTESMLLTLSGAVLGFALVYTIRDVAIASVPEILPRLADVPVDGYVFAFAVVAASVTGLAIGIVPIVRVTRPHLTEILNAATPRATSSRDQLRFRGVLTAVQTALAMTLVVSAGLLVGSFVKLVGVDTGFESQGLVMATVILPQKYDGVDDRRRVFGQMLEQLRLTPSVDAAALADGVPMGGRLAGLGLRREEGGFFNIVTAATSDDFGRVMGIGLRSGRWISAEEVTSGLPVAVVTESVAQELFPGEDPIGQQVVRGLTVVGVVARDMRWSMKSEPQPGLYYPYTLSEFSNFDGRTMVIAVRSAGLARDSMESVIREIEPDAAIDLRTMDRAIAENVARERFQTAVLATFAGAALLLACLGVYSVVSIGTAERTREIGLRVALGATPVKVVARMMRHGLVPALSGLSVGLVLSTASTRVLEAYLYELDRLDMRVFAFGFAVAMLLVLFASWLPARRAARLDPMEALRHE